MTATALIEHYAFAWKMTGEKRWLDRAKKWMLAAAAWEHSDRIEEHFYTANRYMQAFALGLDLLGDQLTSKQEDQITRCLIKIMQRWWPDVEKARQNPAGGHHERRLIGRHSEGGQGPVGAADDQGAANGTHGREGAPRASGSSSTTRRSRALRPRPVATTSARRHRRRP